MAPGEIERQVKRVLDQPQYKQQAVFAREAHENIEKQVELNKSVADKITQQEQALTGMHETVGYLKRQMFDTLSEATEGIAKDRAQMSQRMSYAFAEIDAFKVRYDAQVLPLDARAAALEGKVQALRELATALEAKIPPSAQQTARELRVLDVEFRKSKAENEQRFGEVNKDIIKLKKVNSLALLEHKLCDRMDDITKAMSRTMADRFETAKKFRRVESQLKNVFELTLISLRDSDDSYEIKQELNSMAKGAKQLQNPNSLMLHLKAHMAG